MNISVESGKRSDDMSDQQKHKSSGKQDDTPERPSQAEGERSTGGKQGEKPDRPSQAEGERSTVEENLRRKGS
jgi:hypothetical protein